MYCLLHQLHHLIHHKLLLKVHLHLRYYLEQDLQEVYFLCHLIHLDKVMILKLRLRHLILHHYQVLDQMTQKHHLHHQLQMLLLKKLNYFHLNL